MIYTVKRRVSLLAGLLVVVLGTWLAVVQPAAGQGGKTTFDLILANLIGSTKVLNGPSDKVRYSFNLPSHWQPQVGSSLQLDLAYVVSGETQTLPGTLEVRLNEKLLTTVNFRTSVITSTVIEISPEILRLAEQINTNDLDLRLSVPQQCNGNYSAALTVQASSMFHFVYQERPLALDLALFPKPFYYSRALETLSPTHIILPAVPSANELESTAMIAANLGHLSGNSLPLQVSLGTTLPVTISQQNLIIVGSPERIPLLSQLKLPLPLQQRRLQLRSQMPATVKPGQPFSYTLVVKNTAATTQNLVIADRLSPLVKVEVCPQCAVTSTGLVSWPITALAPGQTISATVQARPDETLGLGETIEHTASLFEAASGQVVNVDTLTTTLTLNPTDAVVVSPVKGDYFFSSNNQGVSENDGVVQLLVSSWAAQRAIIAVTGLNDAAVLKAAHALATQSSMPGMHGQVALVQAVRPITPTSVSQAQKMTLAELGYPENQNLQGNTNLAYVFNVPRGGSLTTAAYLALHLAHGVALNTISATLEVRLNGLPIHSIELQDANATDTWAKVPLPAQSLKPGQNQLDLFLVATLPACLSPEMRARFWITLYADSFFDLPYQFQGENSTFVLDDYPNFLSASPNLQDVVLLLPAQVTVDEATGMAQLFSFLGQASQSNYFTPQIALSNQATPEQWLHHHLIVVGRPSQNPYIQLVNNELPQPFIPGTDQIRQQVEQIIYRLPANYDLGYVQLLPVPWDNTQAMVLATGTSEAGLRWALQALADNSLSYNLKGNLALLTAEKELRTFDTRETASAVKIEAALPSFTGTITEPIATPTLTPTTRALVVPIITPTPKNLILTPTAETPAPEISRPIWVIPMLVLSFLILVGTVGLALRKARF